MSDTNPTPARGRFIVLEGIDGCGKTTQIEALREWLPSSGLLPLGACVVVSREPGGTALGQALRELLLHPPAATAPVLCAELLLYAADRAQHVETVLRPALERGDWVLCDRFTGSTAAYQGYGRGWPVAFLDTLETLTTGGLQADLTLWLDVPLTESCRRRGGQLADRLEGEGEAFLGAGMTSTLHLGDCLEVLRAMPDKSVDAVVTDPPYGLSFMGKRWDYDVPSVAIWAECLRVLKPGGHLLAFAGTRTQHRMAVRIEDAGFEIRDMIAWVYGSGFPKSLDVSKAIDKAAGAERAVTGSRMGDVGIQGGNFSNKTQRGVIELKDAPATTEAQQWAGWGTALKPSWECITMARKPLAGTVAANVLEHGTGALNVDGCRVGDGDDKGVWPITQRRHADLTWTVQPVETDATKGRWPANLIHDGSDEVVGLFPQQQSGGFSQGMVQHSRTFNVAKGVEAERVRDARAPDTGSAARFFYIAKASRDDRDPGNTHPTVKPTDLMRYLCRLVTPPGGIVLDPFMGSGSTGKAAMLEGFGFIGIEREAPSYAIAQQRISRAQAAGHQPDLFASVGPAA